MSVQYGVVDDLPTRGSLLQRLRDLEDDGSWRLFFETYWRLIYSVARRSGLEDDAAQDVVQETVISLSRKMPSFEYNPEHGSFKNWLLLITRRRIQDHFRRLYRSAKSAGFRPEELVDHDLEVADPGPTPDAHLAGLWEAEWQANVLHLALGRVKQDINPKHFQVFEYVVTKGWKASKVASYFGLNIAQVYLTKHRVGEQLKKAVQEVQSELSYR